MIGYDGTVKLLDFGVAMSSVTDHSESMIAGKWAYMSPEHTANQSVDHRSDLFSLGVMMYLLCTGSMPFSGNEPREIVKKIRAGQYKPVEEMAPHVPPAVAHLVGRLLASRPEDRPQTGQEVVAAIVDSAGGYAGFTLFPTNASVLTVEFKVNLLAPAAGERLLAEGFVVKPGRTLAITRGEVHAEHDGKRTLVAMMQQTLMVMHGKPDE
jgi:serine/threonine protein kinase